jgi:mannose-1-phosphate guanylyltransferase/mannose-6-phosphate isomerase
MKSSKRKEVSEHVTTYRPWGSYTVLEEGERYKIKRIEVNPGAVLSLQRHRHRSEHWVVVKGVAQAQIGDETVTINENESCFVPMQQWHRLSNPGRIPLEMIEVQNGTYVGVDDIERKDDQ